MFIKITCKIHPTESLNAKLEPTEDSFEIRITPCTKCMEDKIRFGRDSGVAEFIRSVKEKVGMKD